MPSAQLGLVGDRDLEAQRGEEGDWQCWGRVGAEAGALGVSRASEVGLRGWQQLPNVWGWGKVPRCLPGTTLQ